MNRLVTNGALALMLFGLSAVPSTAFASQNTNASRLNAGDDGETTETETTALPTPLVQYTFENGQSADDSGTYAATLYGSARIVSMDDGNKVLYTGAAEDNGYMDLGGDMAKETLGKITGDYTFSIDLLLPNVGQLSNYCWAYALSAGTNKYIGLVNNPNNTNWYFAIKNMSEERANSNKSLSYGVWHNFTLVRKGTRGYVYVDGDSITRRTISQKMSAIATAVTEAYLGRSPFSSDSRLTEVYIDNFRIYDSALTTSEVKSLYDAVKDLKTTSTEVSSEADRTEIANFGKKFNFLHTTTVLPTATEAGTAVAWTFTATEANNEMVSFADNTLTVNTLPQSEEKIKVGTLTATMGETTVELPVHLAPDDNREAYLYCFMNSGNETTNFALGSKEDKGHKFNVLLGGDEIFDTEAIAEIEHGTRDTYLGRGEGTDGYFITTTDMKQAVSGVWNNYGLNLVRSKDLIHWEGTTFNFTKGKSIFSDPDETTDAYKTDSEYANIRRVWAPQFIWDKDANNGEGAYLVYYSLLSSNSGDDHDRIFYSYADREFKTLTQPRVFFDPGYSVIDADIVYNPYDSLYHFNYKREGASGSDRGVYEATCEKLVGGTWNDVLHVTNEGSELVEGASTIRRINEDVWNLYYMRYSGGSAYKYCELDYLGLNPSSSAALEGTGAFQHGSFMTITKDENTVLQAWSDITAELSKINAMKETVGTTEFDEAIAQATEALAQTSISELAVSLPAAIEALKKAESDYKQHLCDNLAEGDTVDFTYLLVNPDFTKTSGEGWEGTSFTAVSSGVAEFYNKTFDKYQLLEDMPAGKYRLEAQGFYRYGNISTAYPAHTAGTEKLLAVLYINDQSSPFMSLYDPSASYTYNPYTYPDGVSGANTAFNTDRAYTGNYVEYELTEKGDLKVGVAKTTAQDKDWTCFDNFKLYYTAKPVVDGINGVENGASTAVDVYGINGVKLRSGVPATEAVKSLEKGVYIVGKQKVVVK